MRRLITAEEYILDRVELTDRGCWEWQGHRNGDGYAISLFRGKWQRAHRFAYETFTGPIPEGLTIDHLCMNRWCVNPAHLDAVTAKENVLRSPKTWGGRNLRKQRCPKGHLLDGISARQRYCKTCSSLYHEQQRQADPNYGRLDRECKNGHPRTPESTYVSNGRRRCRICRLEQKRKPGGYKDPNRQRATHCPHGHEYTPENTYTYKNGSRYCRTCNREAVKRSSKR